MERGLSRGCICLLQLLIEASDRRQRNIYTRVHVHTHACRRTEHICCSYIVFFVFMFQWSDVVARSCGVFGVFFPLKVGNGFAPASYWVFLLALNGTVSAGRIFICWCLSREELQGGVCGCVLARAQCPGDIILPIMNCTVYWVRSGYADSLL